MFAAMMDGIKEESVGFLFNLEVQVEEEPTARRARPRARQAASSAACSTAADGAPVLDVEKPQAPQIRAKGLDAPKRPQQLSYSAPSEDGEAEVVAAPDAASADDAYAGVGRNANCPCGSGKKYKKCHGAPGGPTGLTTRVNG